METTYFTGFVYSHRIRSHHPPGFRGHSPCQVAAAATGPDGCREPRITSLTARQCPSGAGRMTRWRSAGGRSRGGQRDRTGALGDDNTADGDGTPASRTGFSRTGHRDENNDTRAPPRGAGQLWKFGRLTAAAYGRRLIPVGGGGGGVDDGTSATPAAARVKSPPARAKRTRLLPGSPLVTCPLRTLRPGS